MNDYQWYERISMHINDFDAFQCISIHINAYLWISKHISECWGILLNTHVYIFINRNIHEYQLIFINVFEYHFQRLSRTINDYQGLSLIINDYHWLSWFQSSCCKLKITRSRGVSNPCYTCVLFQHVTRVAPTEIGLCLSNRRPRQIAKMQSYVYIYIYIIIIINIFYKKISYTIISLIHSIVFCYYSFCHYHCYWCLLLLCVVYMSSRTSTMQIIQAALVVVEDMPFCCGVCHPTRW
jgi:hypothetical protein